MENNLKELILNEVNNYKKLEILNKIVEVKKVEIENEKHQYVLPKDKLDAFYTLYPKGYIEFEIYEKYNTEIDGFVAAKLYKDKEKLCKSSIVKFKDTGIIDDLTIEVTKCIAASLVLGYYGIKSGDEFYDSSFLEIYGSLIYLQIIRNEFDIEEYSREQGIKDNKKIRLLNSYVEHNMSNEKDPKIKTIDLDKKMDNFIKDFPEGFVKYDVVDFIPDEKHINVEASVYASEGNLLTRALGSYIKIDDNNDYALMMAKKIAMSRALDTIDGKKKDGKCRNMAYETLMKRVKNSVLDTLELELMKQKIGVNYEL